MGVVAQSPTALQRVVRIAAVPTAAFLAFAIMVFLFAGSLFFMDKVRRKHEDQGR